ncbi:MAG: extracellular solute-binding protein [Clostridia bacterium]
MKKWLRILSLSLALMMLLPMLALGEAEMPTFKIAIVRWTDSWGTDFTKTAVLQEMAEKAGVKIEWDVYYYDNWQEQKSLMLASGNLPDAFFGEITLSDTDIAQNNAYFVDLAPHISTAMPNLAAIFEKDPAMKALSTNREGKIYGLPKKLPLRPLTAFPTYINRDWLNKLGLEMPTTYQELEAVLEAFVTKDPNGNSIADEVGYAGPVPASARKDINELMIPFGTQASRAGNYMGLDAQGKPYFVPTAENYRQGVQWVRGLYEKGLLSQERFTQTSDMVAAKTQAEGGSLTGICFAWTADAEVGANAAQFQVMEAVKGPDGNRYVESDPTYLNYARNEFVVTSACKDVDKLLSFADLFYDDLVSLQTYYGSIGDGKIKDNGDGTYTVLVPQGDMSLDTSCWTYSFRDHGPKYMSAEFEKNVILPTDQGDGIKLADDAVNAAYARPTFPVCSYTEEQLLRLSVLATDIKSYVEQTYAHWVVDGGIDEEWDAYVEQLRAMGLEEYLAIYEDAFAAYQAQ